MRYFVGLLFIAFGFFIIWKTDLMIRGFGRIEWAEQKLGGGGTWTFYKIAGVAAIFFGFLLMTGDIVTVLDFIFARR